MNNKRVQILFITAIPASAYAVKHSSVCVHLKLIVQTLTTE